MSRNGTEAAYLSSARGIVLEFGRAISRRKQQWSQSLEAARVEREQTLEHMRESTNQKAWLVTFIWKLRYYRTRMCEAWKQYTGEEFPRTASYEMVVAGDIETRKEVERQRLSYSKRTTLWLMRRFARLLRGRWKGEKDEEETSSPHARSASFLRL